MCIFVDMKLRNHEDTQPVKPFKWWKSYGIGYIHDIKFGMLQVRENEISLRK